MSTNAYFEKIVCVVLAICMVIASFMYFPEAFGISKAVNWNYYPNHIFDDSYVHSIDVIVDPTSWQTLLDTASDKEYINCNLLIDNQLFTNIGIRAKGNSSLTMVNSSDSDRYSFKIEFDQYDNSTSYYGLDKLTLNNIIQDSTYMKDYLVYTLMGEFGVPSPLVSYTELTVNGEPFGLYLAVEAIEEGFLQRNYGNNYGYAYKPETSGGAGGGGGGMPDIGQIPGMEDIDPTMLMQMMQNIPQDEIFQAIADVTGKPLSEIGFDTIQTLMTDSETISQVLSLLIGENTQGQTGQMGGMGQGQMPDMTQGQMPEMTQGQGQPMGGMGEMPDMTQGQQMGQMPEMAQGQTQPTDIPADDRLVTGDRPLEPNVDGTQQMPQMGETQMQGGAMPQDGEQTTGRGQGGQMGGMGGMGSSISSALEYIDDNVDSYAYIFDNSVSNISNNDKNRLISSLEQLSNGENLAKVLDIEQVIRYFVVHNFVLNYDSYTGAIMHNYYIYEKNGQISMLPWDYNLSFVDFMNGGYDTQELINFPIDTPVSTGTMEARPMLNWIFENEEYTELYHEIFNEFIETYFESGWAEEFILTTAELIDPYVESDPSKFITYETFEKGVPALIEVVTLRAQSIRGQLNGEIPTTADGQKADPTNLIQTNDLQITDTGSTQMGGTTGGGGDRGNRTETGQTTGQEMGQATGQQAGQGQTQGQQAQGQQNQGGNRGQMGQMGQMGGQSATQATPTDYTTLYASIIMLAIMLIGLKFYHKRKI